jgi:hypothetical protein
VWGLAGMLRLSLALFRPLVPRLARRYPRVFDARKHARQIVWSFAPALLSGRLPRPPIEPAPRPAVSGLLSVEP